MRVGGGSGLYGPRHQSCRGHTRPQYQQATQPIDHSISPRKKNCCPTRPALSRTALSTAPMIAERHDRRTCVTRRPLSVTGRRITTASQTGAPYKAKYKPSQGLPPGPRGR
ncbi:hypothetical protein Thpro_021136 [Acidihalobacter prosperus]|uniref:Uncharacterized protein n=1 Tax=Acidihalobacter prosperus TaxID=160660 RepID=A0A1A6C695_9GAMM|nr:hypothetical protein Thpro_021136 [Acidihalobacter prosperus]